MRPGLEGATAETAELLRNRQRPKTALPWDVGALLPVEILEDLNGLAGVVHGKLDAAWEFDVNLSARLVERKGRGLGG